MEFGTAGLVDLGLTLREARAYVRAAFDRAGEEWTLRTAYAVCGAEPPRWKEDRWRYQRLLLAGFEMPSETFVAAFDTEREGNLRIDGFEARVPLAGTQTSWHHKPSRAQHDASPLPWPTIDYEISRQDVDAPTPQSAFQIGGDCPSFPDDASAIRAFLHRDFSTIGASAASSYPLAIVRIAQVEAWIEEVRVTSTHLDARIGGDRSRGARLEINGSTLQTSKTIGRSGLVRIPLADGLPDDAWLYLSRGLAWLDYRPLGPRLAGARDLAARGVEVELPSDPEGRARALIAQGEGPRIEFKLALPDANPDRLRTVLKTVAAFATGDGGDLVFGVDADEVTTVGLDAAADIKTRDRLGDLIRRHVVPTPVFEAQSVTVDGKSLIVLSIRRGGNAPYGLQLGLDRGIEYFVRRGASTFPATQAEVRASVVASLPRAGPAPSPFRFG